MDSNWPSQRAARNWNSRAQTHGFGGSHGEIRGYYEATEADAVTKLLADTSHLHPEQPIS